MIRWRLPARALVVACRPLPEVTEAGAHVGVAADPGLAYCGGTVAHMDAFGNPTPFFSEGFAVAHEGLGDTVDFRSLRSHDIRELIGINEGVLLVLIREHRCLGLSLQAAPRRARPMFAPQRRSAHILSLGTGPFRAAGEPRHAVSPVARAGSWYRLAGERRRACTLRPGDRGALNPR